MDLNALEAFENRLSRHCYYKRGNQSAQKTAHREGD